MTLQREYLTRDDMKVTERQRATLLGGENYNKIQIIVMRAV